MANFFHRLVSPQKHTIAKCYVRISENLLTDARKHSKVDHRSITGQIEHWARIGKCVEENPDLTYDLIKEMLIGIQELDQGEKTEYTFG